MQDIFFIGILCAIALGLFLVKSIFFIIHLIYLDTSNKIIQKNTDQNRMVNHQIQQIQSTVSSIEAVVNWKTEDPRLTDDMKQQFLMKTRTRRSQASDRISPKERVPLATTDFGDVYEDESDTPVPIYTYDPSTGGTQV